jgi:hypothetical protein
VINFFRKRRLARETRELERRHQAWLERENEWWHFMLTMDAAHGKVSQEEVYEWRTRIANGEEYVGWALKDHHD